jgi:hypothetical protein
MPPRLDDQVNAHLKAMLPDCTSAGSGQRFSHGVKNSGGKESDTVAEPPKTALGGVALKGRALPEGKRWKYIIKLAEVAVCEGV